MAGEGGSAAVKGVSAESYIGVNPGGGCVGFY